MREKFMSVGDILKKAKAFETIREIADDNRVIEEFGDIFPDLKRVVYPVKIEKRVLFLHVENSVWRNELSLRQKLIIEKINKYFDKDVVKTIKFISR